ncbi:hypothetical protein D9X30_3157 [Cupriavidus sp. U2]|uniref:hypothetical protein n=1 Tax=Cupriavidus sp. U2 TaxID=2920269 RepID=UPI00129E3F3C|nr:hypothetical protein [Cupriavidus sp. U2]KAI3591872.1 hypothetical protein D9X30_3157 [Cupriavidus sp. U2]
MKQDPDPWYSSEFWQRALIGVLMLALAYLLASPADARAAGMRLHVYAPGG